MLINFKGKISNVIVEKPGGHHLIQMIKDNITRNKTYQQPVTPNIMQCLYRKLYTNHLGILWNLRVLLEGWGLKCWMSSEIPQIGQLLSIGPYFANQSLWDKPVTFSAKVEWEPGWGGRGGFSSLLWPVPRFSFTLLEVQREAFPSPMLF